jgi:hypothetical protein
MTTSTLSKVGAALGFLVLLAAPPPSTAESVSVDCPEYAEAVLRAKAAMATSDRSAAIDHLERATTALRACTLRSQAELTISG